MFTGIVEEIGTIQAVVRGAASIVLTIKAAKVLTDVHLGDSIAVNGVCLTVVGFTRDSFSADVMPETMRRTNLAHLQSGSVVNLERALRLEARLGGHIVNGHVDAVSEIISLTKDDNAVLVKISAPAEIAKYIVAKGSVALDGVSLTVVQSQNTWFSVSLIPHTAQNTTLLAKKAGDFVNIETDVVGKYVERLLAFHKTSGAPLKTVESKITQELLEKYGF